MAEPPIRIGGSPHHVKLTAVARVCSGTRVAQKEAPPKRGLFAARNRHQRRISSHTELPAESRTQLRSRTGARRCSIATSSRSRACGAPAPTVPPTPAPTAAPTGPPTAKPTPAPTAAPAAALPAASGSALAIVGRVASAATAVIVKNNFFIVVFSGLHPYAARKRP